MGPVGISSNAFEVLARYPWPGNARELENVISRAALKVSPEMPRGDQLVLEPVHWGSDLASAKLPGLTSWQQKDPDLSKGFSLRDKTKGFQRNIIKCALVKNEGNWAATACDLGMHRSNLHNFAARLGLRKAGR